ncbi:MAG: sulfatase-like hydrolase/transferase [Bacteroidales bacterium]
MYASDNGPWLNFGNHGGSAFPLREGKGTAWEGGVRVPCVMKWPGEIKPIITTDEFMTTMDIIPTIAAITDTKLPDRRIDGINMLPFLKGDVKNSPRNEFYYYYEGNLCAVRKNDWKLVLPHTYRSYEGVEPGRDGWPGPYARGESGLELYNLNEDVAEKNDLADQFPEIIDALNMIAEEARRTLGDDILDMEGLEVRPCGRVGSSEKIENLAKGKKINLVYLPAKKYNGKGPQTIIDGELGSFDFLDGKWLGFRGDDLEITIDLGEKTQINGIDCRFLLNQVSWIFLPGQVEISISDNNTDFRIIFIESFDNKQKDLKIDIKKIGVNTDIVAQFIKVKAKAIGNCPEWHPAKKKPGGCSWMKLL